MELHGQTTKTRSEKRKEKKARALHKSREFERTAHLRMSRSTMEMVNAAVIDAGCNDQDAMALPLTEASAHVDFVATDWVFVSAEEFQAEINNISESKTKSGWSLWR